MYYILTLKNIHHVLHTMPSAYDIKSCSENDTLLQCMIPDIVLSEPSAMIGYLIQFLFHLLSLPHLVLL